MHSITIESRFCGPPTSANGGYCAGALAQYLANERSVGSQSIEVTLHAPPPLDEELQVEIDDEGHAARLVGAGVVIAAARRVERLHLVPPRPVSFAEAAGVVDSSPVLRDVEAHPFPTCFVCGPARAEGDGLRLFPAQLPGRVEFAAPYVPSEQYCSPEFVWAALDCPSSFPMYLASDPLDGAYVLGRITADVPGALVAGDLYVVVAWREQVSGRKLQTAVVLCDDAQQVVASARATWIRIQ